MKLFKGRKKKLATLLHVERPRRMRPAVSKRTKVSFRHFSSTFNKKISTFTTPKFFLACVSITFLGVAIGVVFFSSFFKLQTIVVTRDSAYINPQAVESFLQSYKSKNIFLIDTGEIKQKLMDNFPVIAFIETNKAIPQTLRIKITAYPIFSRIMHEGSKKEYFLNTNGVIVVPEENQITEEMLLVELPKYQELSEEQYRDLLTLYTQIEEGKKMFSKEYMSFFQKIVTIYEKNFEPKMKRMIYYPIERELHIEVAGGALLYIALGKDIETQFFMLKTFITNNNVALEKAEYAYIDLRIKDKVITCKKNAACTK